MLKIRQDKTYAIYYGDSINRNPSQTTAMENSQQQ